jgi:hypothetical protein
MRIYTGDEIHGHADYKSDEPRWVDARELDPILRLIDDNADLMREPGASLKAIRTIIRQVGVWKCPRCGVNYTIGSRHLRGCNSQPTVGSPASEGQRVAISKDIDDFPGPEDFGVPSRGSVK